MKRNMYLGLICNLVLAGCESYPGAVNLQSNLMLPPIGEKGARPPASTAHHPLTITTIPYSCSEFDDKPAVNLRNDCAYDLISDINYNFTSFRDKVQSSVDYTNFALDFASIGLGAAGTAVASNTAKTVLSAINTGVSGTKTSLNQDILYKNSVEILLVQMQADRDKQFSVIVKSLATPDLATYPMSEARIDLIKYYEAGTWSHALGSLQATTGASAATAAATADNARTFKADNSVAAAALLALLTPNGVYDSNAAKALSTCVDTIAVPSGLTLSNYKDPDGGKDLGSLATDSAVDPAYKMQLLACAKAGLAKQIATAKPAAAAPTPAAPAAGGNPPSPKS